VWLERCAKEGIPAVPAIFSPEIKTSEIFAVCDGKGAQPSIDAAAKWLETHLQPGTMWRWEQCAPMDLKCVMGDAGGSAAQHVRFNVDDPRLVDILLECNIATTRLAVRPVVPIIRFAYFPVEFRCYVFDDRGISVSNYYPQRSLPSRYFSAATECAKYAERLHPHVGTAFTADFCITGDEILFLEGGPPWGAGAHPCCFNPKNLTTGRVVLEREEGSFDC
jgi:hypothetical protein